MDKQTAIDRITETENLTDNLEDDEANWLIDWGINKASEITASIKSDDAAGEKLDAVMAVMRKLNQIAGSQAAKPEDIQALAKTYAEAFGSARPLDVAALKQASQDIKQKSPQETLEHLIALVAPGPTSPTK